MSEVRVSKVYLLSTEERPGDVYTVTGVVVRMSDGRFSVFCPSASHNLYKAAVDKFPWNELERGVSFRGTAMRLTDWTQRLTGSPEGNEQPVSSLLAALYQENPRQYFFLRRFLPAF
ncbi:MAG: hypothetical protein K6T31_00425 [Alicyclobacillus sp.]|nr:hypothetical protein [Alicyclobacillus sp.]